MSNLKGGSFKKQHRDANFKLAAFKTKRNGSNSHKTHSEATRVKREGYLNDFQEYLEEMEIDEGKINQLMNEPLMSDFLAQRLDGLAYSTQEDYLRGWSGMVQGLMQANVTVVSVSVSLILKWLSLKKRQLIVVKLSVFQSKWICRFLSPM